MRIAIVDDDTSVRKALRRLLEASGFEVDVFASGREFLSAPHELKPDCVIADLNMPEMGGLELLRVLAGQGDRIPVIILTAFDTPQSRAECERLGAAACLSKPIGERVLLSTIAAAVRPEHSATTR